MQETDAPELTTGQRIALLRRGRTLPGGAKLTQKRLADALGVARGTVAAWETDAQEPSEEHLTKLSSYFGTTAAYIRTGRQDAPRDNGSGGELPRGDGHGEGGSYSVLREFWSRFDRIEATEVDESIKILKIDAVAGALWACLAIEAEASSRSRSRAAERIAAAGRARALAMERRHAVELTPEEMDLQRQPKRPEKPEKPAA